MTLEFDLHPEDWARLLRLPAIRAARAGRAGASPYRIVWHDTPDGTLAAQGCALSQSREGWRLERIWPGEASWAPATPPPLLAADADLAALAPALSRLDAATGLMPLAAFEGTRRTLILAGEAAAEGGRQSAGGDQDDAGRIDIVVLDGVLRTVAAEQPACLCRIGGAPAAVRALALALAGSLRLSVPRQSLAARGRALAHDEPAPPRRLGAPGMTQGMTVEEALDSITAWLTDVILHWLPLVASEQAGVAVHQTRVAVRRLRSALSLFARALPPGTFDTQRHALQELALRLGPARDWDVFLGGTARELAAHFTDERRVTALLAAGERRRGAIYATLHDWLRRPELRQLEVALACDAALRPWEAAAAACAAALAASSAPEREAVMAGDTTFPAVPAEASTERADAEAAEPADTVVAEATRAGLAELAGSTLALPSEPPNHSRPWAATGAADEPACDRLGEPCRDYAREMLARRHRRLLRAGADLDALAVPALHDLRKDAKRLRYACEFFAPLFPGRTTRRFLRSMEPLQEALGHLNDAAVASALVSELGSGPARAFAAGAVRGFVAGRAGRLRRRIDEAWADFRDADPFWE